MRNGIVMKILTSKKSTQMIVCYFVALALAEQQCSHHPRTWCCLMPQNFVAIQNTNYKVLTQHIIWRIRCVNGDERQRMDVNGWMDVHKHLTELWRTWNEMEWMAIATTMDGAIKRSTFRKICNDGVRKIFFFFFYFMFFCFLFSSYSPRAATRVIHYMITSSKTHRSARPKC
jgi:hypothetical protein